MPTRSLVRVVACFATVLLLASVVHQCSGKNPGVTGPSFTVRNRSDFRVTVVVMPGNESFQLDPGKNRTLSTNGVIGIQVLFPDGRRFTGLISDYDTITINNDSVSR